jgi:flagellar hook-associated protein 1 FlgK
MSFQALNAALSGLRVAQQQLTTVSNNVSNATTPGYTRKILPQTTQVINSTGQIIGVQSETLIRRVDLNLEKELWTQVSGVSGMDVTSAYLDRIEKFHGPTDKEFSIAAEIAQLKDKFAALSDSPSDGFLQQAALEQAKYVATKFNDFSDLVGELRRDAQSDMDLAVDRINDLLGAISTLNAEIKGSIPAERSVAALEDKRDEAVKELAGYMNLTFFSRGDGVLVVQTTTGVQLADERPTEVFFNPGGIGASTTYPSGLAGVYVGGDPLENPTSVNITTTGVGGKLGALIDLRDNTLVRYQAQVDELAHKLALRLESQGLRLFTNGAGVVPADTPPDPTVVPPVPVSYVGFASDIQVNAAIVNDINLLQQGTYTSDVALPSASNELIRRVIQFGFGNTAYQEASGTTNLNISLPATDLQSWLGLYSTNEVIGGIDFSSFAQIDDGLPSTSDLIDTMQQFFPSYPANDQFQVTFEEPRLGLGPTTITVDLSAASANFPLGPGVNNALDQIISEINAQITAAGVPAGLAATATRNGNGQLVISSRGNVTINGTFAGGMGTQGLTALGLSQKTYATEDPYFDIQVGTNQSYRITLEPGDTVTDLVNKLEYDPLTGTGVPGLYVNFDAGTGRLYLRPGMDDSNGGPSFGGDLRIVAGPAQTDTPVNPVLAALPESVNIVSALFGSYSVSGGNVSETTPLVNVLYGSETTVGSGQFVAFRKDYLGPAADVSTGIQTGANIIDFGQKMVNAHAQDIILNDTKKEDATSLRDLLQKRLLDETGVNIDEELSTLIVIQTAYSASARAVSAASEMFDDLLNAIR